MSSGWLSDFAWAGGRVRVRKTGAVLAIEPRLVRDVLVWFGFFIIVRARAAILRRRRAGPSLWFAPDTPRPWYLVWAAATWAGVRFAPDRDRADAVFAFEDAAVPRAPTDSGQPVFNAGCVDVSKSRVATVFAQVAGCPLAVDPTTWNGVAVRKSEANGTHDGRLVVCPCEAAPGMAYQRLIQTGRDGWVEDLRTPCVDGRPVVVWRKRRPAATRFDIYNTEVVALAPEEVFSPEELALIARFCTAMALDWGGLDVLRDAADGRLYIVDVNPTDVGPVLALSLRDKLNSISALGRALRTMVEARVAAGYKAP